MDRRRETRFFGPANGDVMGLGEQGLESEDETPEQPKESLGALWTRYEEQQHFFPNLQVDPHGGIQKAGKLYHRRRVFIAIGMLLGTAVNVYAVVARNLTMLTNADEKWCLEQEGSFLLFNVVLKACTRGIIFVFEKASGIEEQCPFGIRPDVLVGLLEFTLLACFFLRVLWYLLLAANCCSQVVRWQAVHYLFTRVLTYLRTFSALWALNVVQPQVFSRNLMELISNMQDESFDKRRLATWLLVRMFAGAVGFDAFLVKVRALKGTVTLTCSVDPDAECIGVYDPKQCKVDVEWNCRVEWWEDLLPMCVFLNQILGITQVALFVQHRLFLFMFGGENAFMTRHAVAVMHTWQAMITRSIWRENDNCLKFLMIMLTFSDMDFQQLVLTEKEKEKEVPRRSMEEYPEEHPDMGFDAALSMRRDLSVETV